MSTITGTINGISLLSASPSGVGTRKAYLVSCSFAAYTGASDSGALSAVHTAIATATKSGKTLTSRGAICVQPGADTAGQAVYVGAVTDTTGDYTFNLTNAAGTELTSSTACSGVQLVCVVDES